MNRTTILGAALVVAGLLAGCGDDDSAEPAESGAGSETTGEVSSTVDPDPEETVENDEVFPGVEVLAIVADAEGNLVVVDNEGHSLYAFTPDDRSTPTCTGACAETWPPVTVDSVDDLQGYDPAVFNVVERPGGELQVTVGGWPLYRYSGDAGPGDTNGDGIGNQWFRVTAEGELLRE